MHRFRLLALLFFLVAVGCDSPRPSPSVLFIRDDPDGAPQLHEQTPGEQEAGRLTGIDDPAAPEVIDFAAAPDGKRIVYATLDATGGSALRIMDADGGSDRLLIGCPLAECSGPVWSPDGRRLIYERRPQDGGSLGSPRLYWLDPDSGEVLPLIEGNETPGYGARFSPDGEWLSYVSLRDEGVVVYNLIDGGQRLLSSRVGSPAAWSPNSLEIVYGDLSVQAYETAPRSGDGDTPIQESSNIYLYRSIMTAESPRQRLSPEAGVADSVPAYSPDGQWIAFGRTPANTASARQLWLMRPDGSESRALTDDPAVTHGPPAWSPDGRNLLFQAYDLNDPATGPSVWMLDVATGEETLVAENGYLPAWSR